MRLRQRLLALTCTAALALQLGLPAAAADAQVEGTAGSDYPSYYTEHMIRALEQGDELTDQYMHQDTLFTTDMVHNNPGLEPWTSNYNDSEFLAQRDFDGHVFFLYDCAQYGLLWDKFDEDHGATGDQKVFPEGSEGRAWVEAKRAELHEKYTAAKDAGVKVYFMMDMIVLPAHLKEMHPEILTDGKIDVEKEETQKVMDYMFEEMFTEFPEIDGIYVRYGETYTGSRYGAPYHTGNNPILNGTQTHLALIKYLGDKLYGDQMVDEKPRDVVYRTWGFGGFQNNPSEYLAVSEKVPTNDHLYFCIKHSTGDFHRNVAFNQTIGIGQHQQIVEVQAAREYEGKGAYPNYIIDGVINGFEEYEWLMTDPSQSTCLRDVINTQETPQVKGIWTWSRGGGWNGPYINGVNGIVGDHTSDNKEVVIEDGSEMWDDLNAYVVTQWAKDTSKTDKYYVKQYAKEYLGMDEADQEKFYELCILSAHAVLLGRATNIPELKSSINTWWTRDQNIAPGTLKGNINNAVSKGLEDEMLAEKAEGVAVWEDMIALAESLETDATLIDSPVKVKDYIITTCKYGYYFFAIAEQMNIAGVEKALGDKTGSYDVKAITDALATYDRLWEEWEDLFETAPGCPSLFIKENKSLSLVGYGGNTGTDGFMDDYRESLTMAGATQVPVNGTASLPIDYSYGFSPDYFTFESSDPDVAYVDENGEVVGVTVGKCLITVTTASGLTASTIVEVLEGDLPGTEYETKEEYTFDDAESVKVFAPAAAWNDGAADMTGGGNGRQDHILTLDASYTGMLRFSLDMKTSAVENDHFALRDSKDKTIMQLDFRPGTPVFGLNYGGAGTPQVGDGEYKLDTYYHVEVVLDMEAQQFDVTITEDGTGRTFEAKAQPFREDTSDLSDIRFGARGSGTMTVDNVKVEQLVNAPSVLFSDDFSTDTSDKWTGIGTATWNQDGTLTVTDANPELRLALPQNYTGELTVTWKMKVDKTNARAFLRLTDNKGTHLTQVEFRGGEQGNHNIIVDNSQLVDITSSPYEADVWYDVEVVLDTDTKTYTVTIGDDSQTFTKFKAGATGLGQIHLGTRGAAITVDDIVITGSPSFAYTAADVAAAITSLPAVEDGDTAVTLPVMPAGYTVAVKSSEPDLVAADGTITFPETDTQVQLVLQVTSVMDPADTADTAPITLTIPGLGGPVDTYTVTVKTEGEGTANANVTEAKEGDTVTLTQQADEGWHFVEWKSDDVAIEKDQFQMPAGNVTVTAVFAQDEVKADSILVSASTDIITDQDNPTLQMVATVLPRDAADKDVIWSVTTKEVKTQEIVEGETAETEASATETVETEEPAEAEAAALIELVPAEVSEPVEVAGTEIATIDENGLLTATAQGTVVVTATAKNDPNVSDTMEITIDFSPL